MSGRLRHRDQNGSQQHNGRLLKKTTSVVINLQRCSWQNRCHFSRMGKDQELLDAARNGNLAVVEKIVAQRAKRSGPLASLRRGPGANVQDNSGYTPLHHAALNGHKDVVLLLLAHDASTNLVDNKGSSPLHLAAWTGNIEIVQLILSQGVLPANVNLANHDRETPLHSAAQYGHTDVVSVLLQHNADPSVRNLRDETPLDLAAQYGRLEAVELLVRTHPELLLASSAAVRTHSPLHLASRNGHRNVVQVLLRSGLDVNTRTDMGTALHEAALFGKVDVVRVLLDHGVDLEAEDVRHRTVMDILDELKMHISQEIAAIIKNHSTLISTSDDLENANNTRSSYNYGSHPHHRSLSGGSANDCGSLYQPVPKPRPLLMDGDAHRYGGSVDSYHVPPPPRSLESSLEDSDLSMASSYYQTPPPPRDLTDDAMSLGSYYETPSSSAASMTMSGGAVSRDGLQQRTSLPLDGDGGFLYQVPPPPRETLKRMSDPVESKSRSQGWFKADPEGRMHSCMGYSTPAATSYIPMAPVQGYNRGSLKPPQKPPRKNVSPHSPTKFQPAPPPSNYEYMCMSGTIDGHGSNVVNDCRYYQQDGNSSSDYVEMKMRHSYAAAPYENAFPLYPNDTSWDARYDSDAASGCKRSTPSPTYSGGHLGSPYENVPTSDRRGSPSRYGTNGESQCVTKTRCVENGGLCANTSLGRPPKPHKPSSLNLKRRVILAHLPGVLASAATESAVAPLSPTGYDQPPTPDRPPPSPRTAESGIMAKLIPLSQEYKKCKARRRSRDIETSTDDMFQDIDDGYSKSVATEFIEEVCGESPFAGLYLGSKSHPSRTPTSSEDTCDDKTPTMASAGTSDSEQPPSNASTITNERSSRRSRTRSSSQYENVRLGHRGGVDWTQGVILSQTGPKTIQQPQQQRAGYASSPSPTSAYENVSLRHSDSSRTNDSGRPNSGSGRESLSILSPFDENAEWAQIADIVASFGGSIKTDSVFAREMEEEFTSRIFNQRNSQGRSTPNSPSPTAIVPPVVEGPLLNQPYLNLTNVGLWLVGVGVPEYETFLVANGFDDLDFMGGDMLDDQELFEIGIMNAEHRDRIIQAAKNLPAVIPLPRPMTLPVNDDYDIPAIPLPTVDEWLESLHLCQYQETFSKHRYTEMDRVLRMWEVELTTVLEITRLGHKKRILSSLGERPALPHPYQNIGELTSDLKHLKSEISQLGARITSTSSSGQSDTTSQGGTLRGTKASRKGPAPQPPRLPSDANGNKTPNDKGSENSSSAYDTIVIREPSQLFSGIPTSLTTQWRHPPEALIIDCCNYTAQYLGSTLVRELKGVETTKKSIQKLKKSTSDIVKVPNIVLSISHKGVKFIDAKAKNVVCEHEIRNIHCACQDADDLNHFAYITKDHQTDNHYCHVFSVVSMDLATEVILTLGQAFEVAYQMALRDRSAKVGRPTPQPSKTASPENDVINAEHNRKRFSTPTGSVGAGGGALESKHPTSSHPHPIHSNPDTRQSVAS